MIDKNKIKDLVGELDGINDVVDNLAFDMSEYLIPESACDTESVETSEGELPCEKPLTKDEKSELADELTPKLETPSFVSQEKACSDICLQDLVTNMGVVNKKILDGIQFYNDNIFSALSNFYRYYIAFKFEHNIDFYFRSLYLPNTKSSADTIKQYLAIMDTVKSDIPKSVFQNLHKELDSQSKIIIDKSYYTTLIATEYAASTFPVDVKNSFISAISALDNSLAISGASPIYDFGKSVGGDNTGLLYEFDSMMKRLPTDDEIKTNSYVANVDFGNYNLSNSIMAIGFQPTTYYKASYILSNTNSYVAFAKHYNKTKQQLIDSLVFLMDVLDKKDIDKNKKLVVDSIQIPCCGKKIEINEEPFLDETEDINNNSFQKKGNPELTDLNYWKKYANQLTLVNLLPIYWTIGIIVGPARIRLPTIWIAVYSFHTPFNIVVIFITINGIVVCPVIWIFNMKPIADNQSMLLVMFRGGLQEIKTGTNCEALYQTIVENVDILPDVSIKSPFKVDDLPTYERLSIKNLPYVAYLDKWLRTAKNFMGLP